jgi:hypothetical protein
MSTLDQLEPFEPSVDVQTDYERGFAEGQARIRSLADDVLLRSLADELEIVALKARVDDLRRRHAVESSSRGNPVAWAGYHRSRGINFGTMAETQQGAVSRLMMAGLTAGNQGWEVLPLYIREAETDRIETSEVTIRRERAASDPAEKTREEREFVLPHGDYRWR